MSERELAEVYVKLTENLIEGISIKVVAGDILTLSQAYLALLDNHRWIPVSERLPETGFAPTGGSLEVLITDGEDIDIGSTTCRGTWCSELFDKDDITHWMPLPEPPEEE